MRAAVVRWQAQQPWSSAAGMYDTAEGGRHCGESRYRLFTTGLLVVEKTANGDGFISAFMATDNRGYPLEFRATTPVRPSLVQRTLYGSQLERYVGVELCGKTLIRQSSRKPRTVLVSDPRLLDIADETRVDMLAIWPAGEALKLEEDGAEAAASGTIRPANGLFQPLVYESRLVDPQRKTEILAHVQDCATRFDLAEVFQRMRAALELLAKEDSRYA